MQWRHRDLLFRYLGHLTWFCPRLYQLDSEPHTCKYQHPLWQLWRSASHHEEELHGFYLHHSYKSRVRRIFIFIKKSYRLLNYKTELPLFSWLKRYLKWWHWYLPFAKWWKDWESLLLHMVIKWDCLEWRLVHLAEAEWLEAL